MNLELTDDEAAALIQELHATVENDRYPFSSRPRAEEPTRETQTGARPRALAAAEGLCAAASNCRLVR